MSYSRSRSLSLSLYLSRSFSLSLSVYLSLSFSLSVAFLLSASLKNICGDKIGDIMLAAADPSISTSHLYSRIGQLKNTIILKLNQTN
jgi:hypothetical protein